MRKLIIWNVVTLDGCFEGKQPWDLSFHGLVWGPELEALSVEQLNEADMLVFGEKTYQGMAAHWQSAEGIAATEGTAMNTTAKIVCSTTLQKAEWNNTTIVRDAVKELAQIRSEGNRPVYIFGSGELCQSLLNARLIDEIRLCVAPVILGLWTPPIYGQDPYEQPGAYRDSSAYQWRRHSAVCLLRSTFVSAELANL